MTPMMLMGAAARGLALMLMCAFAQPVAAAPAKGAPDRAPQGHGVLPFIADDYAKALAEARARKLPLFVETWAPWCHSCRSMRAYVFTDPALARFADRYVWLDLDLEKAVNAPFRRRHPTVAVPTYFILDPADESVALRWVGGATVPQFERLLDEAPTAVAPRHGVSAGGADERLVLADSLYGAGKDSAAALAYESALGAAPADWPAYPRAIESLLFAASQVSDHERGVRWARRALPRLEGTPSGANVAANGLAAAIALPDSAPQRLESIALFEAAARAVVDDAALAIAADDRSGVYIALLDARDALQDSAGSHRVAREWAAFLESAAAQARTPDARAVFDSHRLSAYLELGQPERAIPMLQASEKDLPDDYNPPARLATAFKAMKRWDDALAASDRALAKAYGPRKLLILQTRADIQNGRGETAAARRTLTDALAFAEALPPGQRSERTIASLKKKLDAPQ